MTADEEMPVPDGMEEIAKAAAELRAWRGAKGCAIVAKQIGAQGPQWWGWERCYQSGFARPGETYREKIYILTGIAPWRWRTRDEQREINDLRAAEAAKATRTDGEPEAA